MPVTDYRTGPESGPVPGVEASTRIAVVIPCYRVRRHILDVLATLPDLVTDVYVVDDRCPEQSGAFVEEALPGMGLSGRVRVLYHEVNQGVGGAVLTGYRQAYLDGCQIALKLDGDGQMDPVLIPQFVAPLLTGQADYTKGNRFYHPWYMSLMPGLRRFGNLVLSFTSKVSSGYWDILDPTNGYTALHLSVLPYLATERIARRYFFESDMLYHLSIVRAVVRDVPMLPRYADEESNLRIGQVALEFPRRHLSRFMRRLAFNYFIRDFNWGSVQLVLGLLLTAFGLTFGIIRWVMSILTGEPATSGTVMLSALPLILGFQSLLGAIGYDVSQVPRQALHTRLPARAPAALLERGPVTASAMAG